jgi:ABC-type lipoprotein release transport system permease subunit
MSLVRLILAEIRHRFTSFFVTLLVVAGVVFCLAAVFSSLHRFDQETDAHLADLEAKTNQRMKGLENKIRKSMKGLGFNVHIYPKAQDLGEVYEQGYATETMPQSYANKLAASGVVTVNHLLPRLSKRVLWQEKQRTIILIGIKGQIPIAHRNLKKPIMLPVKLGEVVLGYELHHAATIKVGDSVNINGRTFKVANVHPQRGSLDDITAWISLSTAQEMLGKPKQINAILALGCNCTTLDRLGEIRKEIGAVLPETQIIEVESKALARAEARNKVGEDAAASKRSVIETRKAALNERARFTAILIPLVLVGGLIGVAALSFLNTRVREGELGILRAIGFSSTRVTGLVLGRAFLIGLLGTLLGFLVASMFKFEVPQRTIIGLILGAPLLTLAAAWLPALAAMQRDPLDSIRND